MAASTAPRREATPAEVRALAHPMRLRIIRLLFDRSLTNRELAEALGEHPATVLHHVRTLLATGFIEPDAERRGPRGNVEKPYRSTGRSWSLAVEDDRGIADVSRAALDAFLAELRDAEPNADLRTSRLALRLTPDGRAELEDRLQQLLEEYAGADPDPAGEPWAIFVANHRRATPAPLPPLPPSAGSDGATRPIRSPRPISTGEKIEEVAADDPSAVLLVRAQWAELSARYAKLEHEPSSIQDPAAFAPPNGAFFLVRSRGEAIGCGGICRFDDTTAEIKAIYVLPLHRGHGVSHRLMQILEARAVVLGYTAARLETGDAQPEAVALYRSLGYHEIPGYGRYADDPRGVCFERALER